MQDFKELSATWCDQLKAVYSEREARNILLLALEDVFSFNRSTLLISREIDLSESQLAQLTDILSRLKMGEPYQYVVGFTYFDDLKIQVAPGVLIPRPETEELVVWIDEKIQSRTNLKIEDWCTGSGCIALALKNRHKNAEVSGYDISEEALDISQCNAGELNLEVRFSRKDALNPFPEQKVDVIVSNPPYIPWKEKEEMHLNVTEFEPDLALFVPNDDPLLFYRTIANYASKALLKDGLLFFELHENYASETTEMVEQLGFSSVEIRKDLQGKQRMLKAQWSV
ncbi:peptide chain release factor N(5)-glutamine methyltransferase [Fluviicola sp.]|uniref:peptide chain release factor N(5)-glutamine methyltransferase n=1 Tax=Fluviicola sp. TaxID=1917219 RepID=UPI0026230BB2|nr:peptide chain release factor N(5)-glutamine methyltransferase [Fluviicola sp.]